jgi:hypothetical protein
VTGIDESTVDIAGAPVIVRVLPGADKPRSAEVVEAVGRERERILDEVVDDLLEDKNEGWLRDGESPLSEQHFRGRLALQAIDIGPDDIIELELDDDGMFWGHALVVKLDPEYRIVRVDLEG